MQRLNICTQSAADQLKQQWRAIRSKEPGLQANEIASMLGISEGELLAARVGSGVIRLEEDSIQDIFSVLPEVGKVLVLNRNSACIHVKKGWFENIVLGNSVCQVLGSAIDLRMYLECFQYAFAVIEKNNGILIESIQFYDGCGFAVYKVYKTEKTNTKMWQRLINTFAALDQIPFIFVNDPSENDLCKNRCQSNQISLPNLRNIWSENGYEPYEVNNLLKKYNISRLQSLRLLGKDFACKADNVTAELVLNKVCASGLPIKVVTESSGLQQIHTGPIYNLEKIGCWLNVLDEDFNFHLSYEQIAETWVVKKLTVNGPVTSIEMYDTTGSVIAQFYGHRMPGQPESRAWASLADCMVNPSAIAA